MLPLLLLASFTAGAQEMIAATRLADSGSVHRAFHIAALPNLKKRAERQQLLGFLKTLNIPEVAYNEPEAQQWNRLAQTFTHLRLYPLAMKCFLKTLTPDSLANDDIAVTDSDQQAVEKQLTQIGYQAKPLDCPIIKVASVVEKFNDGKQALAYAMVLHVKQPVRGTSTMHKWANTGHTFITLVKYNADQSYTAMSFGFGPHKDNLFSATPLKPSSPGKFTNDGGHEWDEVVGKFISRRRFERILRLTRQYDGLAYNLSTNNCTDFGLRAAELAGLEVKDTKGAWLLGGGNCPAITGESILLGKFSNADTGNQDRLFIDTLQSAPVVVKSK